MGSPNRVFVELREMRARGDRPIVGDGFLSEVGEGDGDLLRPDGDCLKGEGLLNDPLEEELAEEQLENESREEGDSGTKVNFFGMGAFTGSFPSSLE